MPRPLLRILVIALVTLASGFSVIYFFITPACLMAIPVKAKRQSTLQSLENLRAVLDAFRADCDRYPTATEGLAALIHRPADLPGWNGPYLRRPPDPYGQPAPLYIPEDGFGTPFFYTTPTTGTYALFSAGPDKTPNTADDIR